ncbi:MAG TPA: hypothetical protein VEX86_19120 [Longimicrobium sp.]|nr:hypothetical protein [Longimicrobium sp.]
MRRIHLVAALFLPLAACSTVGYAVPGELSTAAPLRVSGRQGVLLNQRLSFGPYATGQVSRSATRGRDQEEEFATEHGEYRQRYSFSLAREGAKVADVACDAEGSGAQTLNVTWRSKRVLQCRVTMADGSLRMVQLESSRDRPLAGRLSGNEGWAITGLDRVTGGARATGTTGYSIARDNGTPVAAVDVSNDGAVYMPGQGDDTIAAVAAALLLYQDPLQASERFRDP